MQPIGTHALVAAVLAGAVACVDIAGPITQLPRELTAAELALIEADNTFAVQLFREVNREEDANENVFISPLSVSMALGMTYNGAAGETMDAMATTLGFDGLSVDDVNRGYRDLIDLLLDLDSEVEFNLANSIWHRSDFPVLPQFLDVNRTFFDAQVEALDFGAPGAADIIDQWVRDHTNGRIEDIAPRPIPSDIVMLLINAIYFKGSWTYEFDKSLTSNRPFTRWDGRQESVPTMLHDEEVPVRRSSDDLVELIEMSYGGDAFTMVVALPWPDVTLDAVIDALDRERWEGWVESLDSTDVMVQMPKFQFEYDIRLNDVLTALGMGIAFDDLRAEFPKINPDNQLFIDRVQHKTFVSVDEEGTEAAAATSVDIGVTSAPPFFVVDRPFLFVLRERISGTILFVGKVVDPTA